MPHSAIHSKRVITPRGTIEATLFIKNGLIAGIVEEPISTGFPNVLDVGDKVVMAGIIDPHVHINEPGRAEWEGFETATKSALAGGITTLVDMPLNASPVTTTAKAFDQKVLSAKNKLATHCYFWGGVVPGNENEIEPLIEKGVLGFKAFLTHSGIDEFPNVIESDLRKVMPVIAKYDLPLLVHCELTDDQKRTGTNLQSYQNYLASRPKKWEDDAIALMIRLCEGFGCRVHIVHLSSANSIQPIADAKKRGLPISVETAQHYLYFNAEEIHDGATQFKCAPPIREKENNLLLWKALKDGIIDFVATDHSPSIPALKETDSGDFLKAWGGISSLQFALPILCTIAKRQNGTIDDLSKWLCENPAKLIGMQHRKGKIEVGFDADLIIWDDNKKFTVTEKIILHKHKITPYLNEVLSGVVERVFLSGEEKFIHF